VKLLRTITYSIPIGFLGLFFFIPLIAILAISFGFEIPGLRNDGIGVLFADSYFLQVIWFSAWQAAVSTIATLILALPAAYAFARYKFRGKTLLRAIATIPFVLPSVVVAAAFTALLGQRGLLNSALQSWFDLRQAPIKIERSLSFVVMAHIFYNFTIVLRIVGGFWSTLDVRLEQAAAMLGANRWQSFREITLPLLLPAIGAAALLIFIFCFSSFGIILLLGGPQFATVEVEIYRQASQFLRLDVASALSLVQMLITLAMSVVYTRLQARNSVPLDRRALDDLQKPARTWPAILLVAFSVIVILGLIGAPLFALVARSFITSDGLSVLYYQLLNENRTNSAFFVTPLVAIRNSLMFAVITTVLALLVGVPASYLLARNHAELNRGDQRWTIGRLGRMLLDPLVMLPLGTSAVTLGLGYVLIFGRPPLRWLGSPWLIPAAHTLLAFPFVVRSMLPALRGLDPRQREAARMLGANPLRVLREIDLPLLFPALVVGAVFSFTASLGEFGAALLIAPPDFPTVPLVINRFLGQPGATNYGQALALSSLLMGVTAASFMLLEKLRFRDIGEF
jgi:thiamine transport system permease protein